jgi:hypothetical protein
VFEFAEQTGERTRSGMIHVKQIRVRPGVITDYGHQRQGAIKIMMRINLF